VLGILQLFLLPLLMIWPVVLGLIILLVVLATCD
jgi:hypothetical protein